MVEAVFTWGKVHLAALHFNQQGFISVAIDSVAKRTKTM